MSSRYSIQGKRALVLGIGLPDGGVTAINWLLDHGARVTVSGMKDVKALAVVVKRAEEHLKKIARDGNDYDNMRSRLTGKPGKFRSSADVIIRTPEDEAELFCRVWPKKIISVTGKHGKTTTATWAAHMIKDAVLATHTPEKSIFTTLKSRARIAIVVGGSMSGVSTDTSYANYPNYIIPEDFRIRWGTHNLANVGVAMHVARIAGVSWVNIKKRIATLPQVPYRQEMVYHDRKVSVVNDTMATSPEAAIAALRRWGGPNCVLITGGTDRELDYNQWADELVQHIRPTNTILLTGSTTDKMRKALGERGRGIRTYTSLKQCWKVALKRSRLFVSSVILFSPAAKSFELFANEFDRGQQFNALVREEFP